MGKTVDSLPSVAVVIVAFNDPDNIRRVIGSLAQTTGPFTLQVVIVDNSTNPAAAEAVQKRTAAAPARLHASYHRQKSNRGFAGGVNAGLQAAHTDYYWLINSDTSVEPDAITRLLETAQRTKAAVVGSRILYGDDKTIYYAGGSANNWLGIVRHPRQNQPPLAHDHTRPVTFVNGCAMFMPATTIHRYGMLFEPYFMYYEETDLCARIIRAGGALYYEPRSVIYHYTPHSFDKTPLAVYFLTRNHWLYIRRNLRRLQLVTATLAVTCFQLYRLARFTRQPALRRAHIAGWLDAVKNHYGPRPA